MSQNKSVTAAGMRELDRKSIEDFVIPGVVLMENAGRKVAEEVQRFGLASAAKVAVLAGRGNNGGDGFVAARWLYNLKFDVKVYAFAQRDEIKGDARTNLDILLKMGIPFEENVEPDLPALEIELQEASLIIDALLGIGIKGEVREPIRSVINLVNNLGRPILAVDVPSGLDADTGEVLGAAIKATKTVTMGLAKKGFFLASGPEYTGEVIIADIGMPRELLE
jgi:NAD(P)H-hydrate epimerase